MLCDMSMMKMGRKEITESFFLFKEKNIQILCYFSNYLQVGDVMPHHYLIPLLIHLRKKFNFDTTCFFWQISKSLLDFGEFKVSAHFVRIYWNYFLYNYYLFGRR